MRATTLTSALIVATLASNSLARIITEDFDGMDFNPELTFDFGTDSDFTGGNDTSDHMDGVLWLYADRATVTVNSLAAGESIQSVSVTWTDFCGIGCTVLELFGDSDNALIDNSIVGSAETVTLTVDDLGEPITSFQISSFEGRFEEISINIVPTPASTALLGIATILLLPLRKR